MKRRNNKPPKPPLGILHLKTDNIEQDKIEKFRQDWERYMLQGKMPSVICTPSDAEIIFIPVRSPKRTRILLYSKLKS